MAAYVGKRITFTAKGKVEILEFTQEKPGAGQVLVENMRSAISPGTELSRLYDYHAAPKPFPQNTGYLSSGRVIEVGEGVKNFKVGDIVLAGFGHLSFLNVDPASLVLIPKGVSLEEAVLSKLSTVSLFGIRHGGIRLGDSVLIMGLGLIGQFAQMLARLDGAIPVVGVDLSERRLDIARQTGLKHALNPTDKNFVDKLKEIVPGGVFNVTIDSTGTPNVVAGLFERTAECGTVVVLGGVHKKVELDLYNIFQKRNLKMVGASSATPFHWPYNEGNVERKKILDLVADGRFCVKPLITHVVPVEEAPEMYRMLHEEKDKGMGVIFKWKD